MSQKEKNKTPPELDDQLEEAAAKEAAEEPAEAEAGATDPLRDELEAVHPDLNLPELSCGMSEDFEPALEEGSTLVRLGRVVFSPEFAVK